LRDPKQPLCGPTEDVRDVSFSDPRDCFASARERACKALSGRDDREVASPQQAPGRKRLEGRAEGDIGAGLQGAALCGNGRHAFSQLAEPGYFQGQVGETGERPNLGRVDVRVGSSDAPKVFKDDAELRKLRDNLEEGTRRELT
jgi:hypothetical protein